MGWQVWYTRSSPECVAAYTGRPQGVWLHIPSHPLSVVAYTRSSPGCATAYTRLSPECVNAYTRSSQGCVIAYKPGHPQSVWLHIPARRPIFFPCWPNTVKQVVSETRHTVYTFWQSYIILSKDATILSYTRAETHIFMLENNYVPNSEIPWKVQKLVDTKASVKLCPKLTNVVMLKKEN